MVMEGQQSFQYGKKLINICADSSQPSLVGDAHIGEQNCPGLIKMKLEEKKTIEERLASSDTNCINFVND